MVVALQQGTIIPTITQQSLNDELKTAFAAAGYGETPYAEFEEDGNKNLVYAVVNDPTKAFGTVYLHIVIKPNLAVSQRLHSTFDTASNTGSNTGDYYSSDSFQSGFSIFWKALSNGSEFKWVMLHQGYRWVCLGIMRPESMPSFWDEDIAPYAIVSDTSYERMQTFYMSEISPYPSFSTVQIKAHLFGPEVPRDRNPFDQQIDLLARLVFYPSTQEGVFGISSAMLAQAGDRNLDVGDLVTLPNGHEYFVIVQPGNSCVLTVRTA
jgi:hypothetical protein